MNDAPTVGTRAYVRRDGDVLTVRLGDRRNALPVGLVDPSIEDRGLSATVGSVLGVDPGALDVVRRGDPFDVAASTPIVLPTPDGAAASTLLDPRNDDGVDDPASGGETGERTVIPALFDLTPDATVSPTVDIPTEFRPATDLLHGEAAPGAWRGYERVAPTIRSIAADDEHGASTLSIRALEVLRDRAGVLVDEGDSSPEEVYALAERLLRARPSMAVVRNRVARVLAGGTDPEAIEHAAIEGIGRAVTADREAAFRAAGLVEEQTVLTCSWSSTVRDTLAAGTADAAFVAQAQPGGEGIDLAEALSDDLPVTVHADAAAAHLLSTVPIDTVLVGADTVLPDGSVVNKVGTRAIALAAAREGVPVHVAAAADKVTTRDGVNIESGDKTAIYDGDADLDVRNPTFDVTPPDLLDGIVTERGVLDAGDIDDVVDELQTVLSEAGIRL